MGLLCPKCNRASLRICVSLELPGDCRSDEIALQIVRCEECGFRGLAVYEESRRGRLDAESVDHRVYPVDRHALRTIERQMKTCPHPRERSCVCPAHIALGRRSPAGRWIGAQGLRQSADSVTIDS